MTRGGGSDVARVQPRPRRLAVVAELLGWLGLAASAFAGAWIVVVTIRVCDELPPPSTVHGGCGVDIVLALVALAIVVVVAVVSLAFVLGGRRWRRPRGGEPPAAAPPNWM
jgi:hypothetical protein